MSLRGIYVILIVNFKYRKEVNNMLFVCILMVYGVLSIRMKSDILVLYPYYNER